MRFDRETEKFRSYLWRITKYIYRRLHLKYFLLLILLFLYALLGGLIFNRIEAPAELVRINSEIAAQRTRHDIFIKSIQQLLLQHLNCTVVASYRSVTKPGLRLFDKWYSTIARHLSLVGRSLAPGPLQ
ncbi:hypothetical protein AB6A40_008686 [Gnathostoma spinigerum]|uniref:Uncharacterized protein n=1 Tax=Gnathostoma spinigerum TaxID=75299 RepID=A0ABD6EZ30_9BILA